MKIKMFCLGFFVCFLCSISSLTSCRTGYGCKATEGMSVNTDRHGNLSTERGKSSLFSKKQKKQKKKSS